MANVGVTFDFAAESAKLRSEIDKVRKELGTLNATAKGIGDGFKQMGTVIAGALSVGAIAGFLSKVNGIADALNDLSGRLGASAAGLQSLQVAAQLAGGSAEGMNVALAKMSSTIGDAAAGNKQAAAAFERLGLSARELATLKADEAFRRIADATAAIPNTFERASAAQDIFGKGAKDIAGLLAEGGAAIDSVNAKLDEQGARLSNLDVAKIGVMNDELQFQVTVVNNLGTKFLAGLTPAIGVATNAVGEMFASLGGASNAGRGFGVIMVAAIKTVEAGVYGLIAVFEGLRTVLSGVLALIAQILPGEVMDGISQSLYAVSRSAEANAKAAGASALKAGLDVLRAGEIFDKAESDFSAKAAAASARATSAQGAFGAAPGALAGGTAAAGKAATDRERLTLSSATLYATANVDPTLDPIYQQQAGTNEAILELQSQFAQTRLGQIQALEDSTIGMLLNSHSMQLAAEESKNVTLGDSMSMLAGMAVQQGGVMGKIGKAYAIAQTVWSTGTAIMKAMAEVPYPANIAAAASVASMGVAQLMNIKKTNVGSGGSIAGVKGGGGSTSAAVSDNVAQPRSTESDQKSAVQIVVQGNLIETGSTATWLAEMLGNAINNRDLVFINGNSRQAMELKG
jgi:hypothetical protein